MTSSTSVRDIGAAAAAGDITSAPPAGTLPMWGLAYAGLVRQLLEALAADPAYAARLQAWGEEQQRAEVKSLLSRESASQGSIVAVLGDWQDGEIDLVFVVEGDLYDGESAALPIMRRLRAGFPSIAFDVMILPASSRGPHFRWGIAPEVLYRRQQAST